MDHILRFLNEPAPPPKYSWGNEVGRLSVPLSIATGRRTASGGLLDPLPPSQVAEFMEGFFGMYMQSQPSLSLPAGTHPLPQTGPDEVQERRLSVEDSRALLEMCRAHGVSITALLNVLSLAAFASQSPERLSDCKTAEIPAFPISRSALLSPPHRNEIGLQIESVSVSVPPGSIQACLSRDNSALGAI